MLKISGRHGFCKVKPEGRLKIVRVWTVTYYTRYDSNHRIEVRKDHRTGELFETYYQIGGDGTVIKTVETTFEDNIRIVTTTPLSGPVVTERYDQDDNLLADE